MGRMASLVLLEPFEQDICVTLDSLRNLAKTVTTKTRYCLSTTFVGLSAAEKADQVRFNFGFGLAPHRPPTAVRVAILH
jgi:hypothetical protein